MIIDGITKEGNLTKIDTDKMRDYQALQFEKHQEIIKWCHENKIYILAFTLDAENTSAGFWNLPQNKEQCAKFLQAMDEGIRKLTKNTIGLTVLK